MKIALPILVRVWFAADLVLALFPPLQWWAGAGTPLFGVPRVVVYLFATSAFIAASVVAAYLGDRERTTA